MSTANTPASAYFARPALSGSVAQVALVASAAGFTAMLWASALGAGDQPAGYIAAAQAGPQVVRVALAPVQIVARRDSLAEATVMGANGNMASVNGCAADRSAHKPG